MTEGRAAVTPKTLRRCARLAVNIASATAAHHWGDQYAQGGPDGLDPIEKGQPGANGRARCLRHVRSYTATHALTQLGLNAAMGIGTASRVFAVGHVSTGLLHYVMDRSRDSGRVPALLSQLPGMPDKVEYFQRGGQAALDQSWHWVCLMGWAVADALASERDGSGV